MLFFLLNFRNQDIDVIVVEHGIVGCNVERVVAVACHGFCCVVVSQLRVCWFGVVHECHDAEHNSTHACCYSHGKSQLAPLAPHRYMWCHDRLLLWQFVHQVICKAVEIAVRHLEWLFLDRKSVV